MKGIKFFDKRIFEILLFCGITLLGSLYGIEIFEITYILAISLSFFSTFLFFIHLYLLNDWSDFKEDALDPTKIYRLSQKLGKRVTLVLSIVFGLSFLFISLLNGKYIFLVSIVLIILSLLYSFPKIRLKSVPFASYPIHVIACTAYFLMGYLAFANNLDLILMFSFFFSLVYIAGEINQELRDYDYDTKTKVLTTPHLIGRELSFIIENALFAISIIPLYLLFLYRQIRLFIFLLYLIGIIIYITYSFFYAFANNFSRKVFLHLKKVYHIIYFLFGILLIVNRLIIILR